MGQRGKKPRKYDLYRDNDYVGEYNRYELEEYFAIPIRNLDKDIAAGKAKYLNGRYKVRPAGTEANRQRQIKQEKRKKVKIPGIKCSSGCRFSEETE